MINHCISEEFLIPIKGSLAKSIDVPIKVKTLVK